MGKSAGKFILIAAIAAVSAFLYFEKGIPLGMDLKGGAELIYTVKEKEKSITGEMMGRIISVIQKRIDNIGLQEIKVQTHGHREILILIPGADQAKVNRAIEIMKTQAVLEFRLVYPENDYEDLKKKGEVPDGYRKFEYSGKKEGNFEYLRDKPQLTGDAVELANANPNLEDFSVMGQYQVSLQFNLRGSKKFEQLTGQHVNEHLAIVLDGKIQSAPKILSKISGVASITGDFDKAQAENLAVALRSGGLPAQLELIMRNEVGPSLGDDSIRKGVLSCAVGMGLVLLFMVIYYRGGGMIANLALILNLVILLGVMAFLQATMTLPGIAGLILSVGMAVDANILIYERIREEKALGRPLRSAITNGYERVFLTILDSNLTTVISAIILYWFGTGTIKGFAVTLIIGILVSMFTAIFVTRAVLEFLVDKGVIRDLRMIQLWSKSTFSFISYRYPAYILSAVVIVAGMAYFFSRGEKAYGVDFTGGTLVQIRLKAPVDTNEIRQRVARAGFPDAEVQSVWKGATTQNLQSKSDEFLIRVGAREHAILRDKLRPEFQPFRTVPVEDIAADKAADKTTVHLTTRDPVAVKEMEERFKAMGLVATSIKMDDDKDVGNELDIVFPPAAGEAESLKTRIRGELEWDPFVRVNQIGSTVANDMRLSAVVAIVLALVAIITYVAFRFEFRQGVTSVVALGHDVLVALAFLAVAHEPVDLVIVAALLTIVGYSINDTIVIFDRVRENRGIGKPMPLGDLIDLSLNQTLSRTYLTSWTVLMVVMTLFFFGGEVIHGFAFAMLVGVISGTYSTIFIACPLVVDWENARARKAARAAKPA
ncbi:MAG: protein translocase subunit SecD [Planctomycetota bacterium]